MSKALVIKGANFSSNKVTTIAFGDPIPCTGITFTTDTITITDGEPVEVTYSVTPANTTDAVTWASSNTSVATVSNGVVTPKGNGTCTVTASCGQYSATATVTVSISIAWDYEWGYGSVTNNHIIGSSNNHSRMSVFGNATQAATYGVLWNNIPTPLLYPIKIPDTVTSVKVSCDSSKSSLIYNNSENLYIEWLKDEPCPDSGFSDYAYYLSRSKENLRNSGVITAQVPSGAESFYITLRLTNTYTEQDDPATIAETLGLSIELE